MRSVFAGLRTLFLPWGTPAGSPRIVIGPDVPSQIATLGIAPAIAGIIFELSATQFHYYMLYGPPVAVVRGTYDTTNGNQPFEQSNVDPTSLLVTWGNGTNTPAYTYEFLGGIVFVGGAAFPPKSTPFFIDGVSAARGLRASFSATTDSSAIGTTETVVATTSTMTFYNGRAYQVEVGGGLYGDTAGNFCTFAIRKNNLAGAQLLNFTGTETNTLHTSSVQPLHLVHYLSNTTGADITSTALALTMQSNTGNTQMWGRASLPRFVRVLDSGAAADNPQAAPIT